MTEQPDRTHRTYRVWANVKARCQNATSPDFKNYGGRGVSLCPAWQTYAGFIADMGYAPDGLQIDRLDNDGNYEPGNCAWKTPKQQCRNKRNNVVLEVAGRNVCLVEAAELAGIKKATLGKRLREGWPLDVAMKFPVSGGAKFDKLIIFKGEALGLTQWAKRLGLPKGTLKSRLSRGWPLERALSNV